jgi:hypothetical protein
MKVGPFEVGNQVWISSHRKLLSSSLEGEKRRHTHDSGTEVFIADVEVVVREAAPLASQDAVVGILGGILPA